jgi:hypothetical protein
MIKVARQAVSLTACIALIGCSRSDIGIVKGSVTVDGEPAKVGAIAFFAVDGRAPTAGAPIVEGEFTAQVNPGVCMVQIRVSKIIGKKKIYDTPDSPVREVWAEVLPAKYNNNTQLKLDVKRGVNEQEYKLTTK